MTTTDPRSAYADQTVSRPGVRTYTESKLGMKTSEFYVMVIAVAGILVATYVDDGDTLTADDGWLYASLVVIAYIVSRGFAKLGTREPYERDRS